MTEVIVRFKDVALCICTDQRCPRNGVLKNGLGGAETRHVRKCPCVACRSTTSRTVSASKQRSQRKISLETAWRNAVRAKDKSTCQRCGLYYKHIDTHHIASRKRRPDLKYDVVNGMCLCRVDHKWVHEHPTEAEALGLMAQGDYERARAERREHVEAGG